MLTFRQSHFLPWNLRDSMMPYWDGPNKLAALYNVMNSISYRIQEVTALGTSLKKNDKQEK